MMNGPVMIGNWAFEFSEGWLAVLAGLLVLALPFTLVACWRRLYPRNPSRAALAAVLNIVAFGTLFLLLTEPQREHSSSQSVILISEGTNLSDIQTGAGDIVYIAPGALPDPSDQQAMANAGWLLDMGQLALREPALASIKLYGYGLSTAQWQAVPENVAVSFTVPPLAGFSDMGWSQTLLMGETMAVQGSFSVAQADGTDGVIELRLLDPAGQQIAQQRIRSGQRFRLMARPKSQGNIVYRLQAWQQDRLLSEQPVTVSVQTSTPLRIMVKQSAPSFETRQLKNFAATIGTEVWLKTSISTGKSITQSVNQADTPDPAFSPASLAASDWLIIDGRALTELPEIQRQWLSEAVQQGLGVLVLADENLLHGFNEWSDNLLRGFTLSADPDVDVEAVPDIVNVPGVPGELTLPVASMQLTASTEQSPLTIIVADQDGRALVASQTVGAGKVAISLINQSYRWVTAGNRTSWSNYWSALSAALGRPQQHAVLIPPAENEFFRENQRAQICAFARQQDVSVRLTPYSEAGVDKINSDKSGNGGAGNDGAGYGQTGNDGAGAGGAGNDGTETGHSWSGHNVSDKQVLDLPLTADSLGSARKCGWFWPSSTGWQNIQLLWQGTSEVLDSQSRYTWGSEQWPGQMRFERLTATLDRLAQTRSSGDESEAAKTLTEPLNTFWLWLLFITCASALWLERKLDWDAP